MSSTGISSFGSQNPEHAASARFQNAAIDCFAVDGFDASAQGTVTEAGIEDSPAATHRITLGPCSHGLFTDATAFDACLCSLAEASTDGAATPRSFVSTDS
ncbi:hypothetical protein [Paeniglutamicibacter sp. NPDC091659]|uniref:hypothetical protein n=1 Tax=Paeniglutamicibacter sp. NPDC091659 TaxID=3364389 RepID=UPI00382D5355